jgi:hypothetical protein
MLCPVISFASSLWGKSEMLLLRLRWKLKGICPVGIHRRCRKTVPVLP